MEALARYEEDEAGGLMTPEYVAVREGMTVEEVLRFLRRAAPDAETIYYIYVVDEKGRLKGVLSLRDLIVADPRTRVAEILNPKVVYVRTDTDQEEVARLMADYDFTVLPVVDEEGRLVGIVTVDDVLDVLEAEATEDIHKLGAVDVPDLVYSEAGPVALWLARVRWLVILILTGLRASSRPSPPWPSTSPSSSAPGGTPATSRPPSSSAPSPPATWTSRTGGGSSSRRWGWASSSASP